MQLFALKDPRARPASLRIPPAREVPIFSKLGHQLPVLLRHKGPLPRHAHGHGLPMNTGGWLLTSTAYLEMGIDEVVLCLLIMHDEQSRFLMAAEFDPARGWAGRSRATPFQWTPRGFTFL